METLLEHVITVFGPSALFVIAAAWLLRTVLIEGVRRETQHSIELLKRQSNLELVDAKHKLDIEKALLTKLRTEFMAENAIQKLLRCPAWKLRSFDAIKICLRGFDDDELRKLLVRSGAVSFRRRSDGKELWGLISVNQDLLDRSHTKEDVDED